MTTETTKLRLPAFEIDIDKVDGLRLQEVYLGEERKAEHFEHEDGNVGVNIWRKNP